MDQDVILDEKPKGRSRKENRRGVGADHGDQPDRKTVRLKDYAKHVFDKNYEQNIERRVQAQCQQFQNKMMINQMLEEQAP